MKTHRSLGREDDSGRASGRIDQLREAYLRYRNAILCYLQRRSGSSCDAEDIAQDVFVRISAAATDAEPIDNPKAFLFRTADNLLTDFHRRRTVRRNYQDLPPDELASPPTPERALLDKRELEAVRQAILNLPTRSKQAFILHRFHHWSHRAIAAHLNISVNAVEKNIIRALKRCRESMDERPSAKNKGIHGGST
ncbi:MAG: sigma-70 family RNA polymerase sigma factor [Rhodospirillaceae bacterium]|nr:sigma-70 family RNA polymerase sigma factor [Rhodospirillaceae bacterium]